MVMVVIMVRYGHGHGRLHLALVYDTVIRMLIIQIRDFFNRHDSWAMTDQALQNIFIYYLRNFDM